MTEEQKQAEIADQPAVISWQDFLQEQPPGSIVTVSGAVKHTFSFNTPHNGLIAPDLQLHCPEPPCNATMFFRSENGGDSLNKEDWRKTYLTYWCRNCRKYSKMFAVAVQLCAHYLFMGPKWGLNWVTLFG